MMRKSVLRFVCLGVLAGLAAACQTTIEVPTAPVMASYEPKFIDDPDAPIGALPGFRPSTEFTEADISRVGIVNDAYPQTVAQMDAILDVIRQRSPVPEIDPQVNLYYSEVASASAASQDYIFVSTGLLQALDAAYSNDEAAMQNSLAFVLAHEYAHLLYDHPRLYAQKQEQIALTERLAQGMVALKTVQSVHQQITGSSNEAFAQAEQAFTAATLASPWLEAELYRVVVAPYTRVEEQQADFLAVDLLSDLNGSDTKYDALAGAEPLRSIYEQYDNAVKEELRTIGTEMETTMKSAADDMIKLAPAAMLDSPDTLEQVTKSRMMMAGLEGGLRLLKQRLDKKEAHLYYSADARVDAINAYSAGLYPARQKTLSLSDLAKLTGSSSTITSTFKQENGPAAAARQARVEMAKGDIPAAKQALAAVTGPDRYKAMIYVITSGDVALADNDVAGAIEYYRMAIRREDSTIEGYSKLATAHHQNGNVPKAFEAISLGMQKFGDEDFIVQKIEIAYAEGMDSEVETALGACRGAGDKDLTRQCEDAAGLTQLAEAEQAEEEGGAGRGFPGLPGGLGKMSDIFGGGESDSE